MSTLHGISGEVAAAITRLKDNRFPQRINNSEELKVGQQWHGIRGRIVYTILELTQVEARVFVFHGPGRIGNREKWLRRSGAQFHTLIGMQQDNLVQ